MTARLWLYMKTAARWLWLHWWMLFHRKVAWLPVWWGEWHKRCAETIAAKLKGS